MKIKKGDTVVVLIGRDKGKSGKVEKIIAKDSKLIVSGVNIFKKHLKPQGERKPGGIIDISKPLDVSKVAFLCPQCKKATRVGYRFAGTKKERICKRCQSTL